MPVPYRSSHSDEPRELLWRAVGFAPYVTGPGDGKGDGCGKPGPVTRRRAKFAHPRGKNNVNLAQVDCGYASPVSRLRLESPTYGRGSSLDSSLRLADVRAGLYT